MGTNKLIIHDNILILSETLYETMIYLFCNFVQWQNDIQSWNVCPGKKMKDEYCTKTHLRWKYNDVSYIFDNVTLFATLLNYFVTCACKLALKSCGTTCYSYSNFWQKSFYHISRVWYVDVIRSAVFLDRIKQRLCIITTNMIQNVHTTPQNIYKYLVVMQMIWWQRPFAYFYFV